MKSHSSRTATYLICFLLAVSGLTYGQIAPLHYFSGLPTPISGTKAGRVRPEFPPVRQTANPKKSAVHAPQVPTKGFRLQDGAEMQATYAGDPYAIGALQSGSAQPRSLATDDLNHDGAPDLLVGYSANGRGVIAIYMGNIDAYAPSSPDVYAAVQAGRMPAAFEPVVRLIDLPEAADFIVTGDFKDRGRKDILVGAQGGGLYLLPGDGRGGFGPAQAIALPGGVTALTTGKFKNASGAVAVGVGSLDGPSVLVFQRASGGLTGQPMKYSLSAEAASLAFDTFDSNEFAGLAVAAGNEVVILHGQGQTIGTDLTSQAEHINVGFNVRSLTLGSFTWNRDNKRSMALLAEDGTVHLLERSDLDTRPFTPEEAAVRKRNALNGRAQSAKSSASQPGAPNDQNVQWSLTKQLGAGSATGNSGKQLLVTAQISPREVNDLLVVDQTASKVHLVQPVDEHLQLQNAVPTGADVPVPAAPSTMAMDVEGTPVGVLAMPKKVNGERDLIVLRQGQLAPVSVTNGPAATITVDRNDDSHTSACTAAANDCSLRGAIDFANANPGSTINIPAGTYQLSLGPTNEQNNVGGDLDVTASGTTIVGAGAATTIIQQTLLDRVVDINFSSNSGFTFSISGVTIKGGQDHSGFGGGGFLTGGSANSYTVTNCIFDTNVVGGTATNTPGGAISLSVGGSLNVSGSTFTNNNSGTSRGGAIFNFPTADTATTFQVTNSTFTSNQADGEGGAITSQLNGGASAFTTTITGSTFTSNKVNTGGASTTGGGAIDTGIGTGNTMTVQRNTFVGNQDTDAGGHAGAVAITNGTYHFNFNRFVNNTTATAVNGNAINSTAATGVDFTDNWWGNLTGPKANDIGNGAGSFTTSPSLTLAITPASATIPQSSSTGLTASFLKDTGNNAITAANLGTEIGLPITFGATGGTITGADTTVQASATGAATFNATAAGNDTASATVDGATASANIFVIAPPTISKAFGVASIPLDGSTSTSLTFTITNPNTGTTLTGIAFNDTLPANLTRTGIGGPGDTCSASVALPNSSTANYSAISLAANSSCTTSMTVKGLAAGDAVNVTSAITSTEGGTGTTSNTATLKVVAPPTISTTFNPTQIPLNGTTDLSIIVAQPAANTAPLTGVAFNDTLPTGLTVPTLTIGVCGGTLSLTAPGTITFSGATLNVGGQCTLVLPVTGAASGQYTNTTGAVSSANGGTGGTASANLTVASPPTITKNFGVVSIPLNGSTTLTFAITNPNTNTGLTGVAFTDTLPAGLQVATPNGLTGSCGSGTITAIAGTGVVSLSGGTLTASPGAGSTCSFSVNMTGTTAGVKSNSVQVTSTEGGTGNTSNASLTVVAPPTVQKAFGAASIPLDGVTTTTLTFTISNDPANTTASLSGIAFSDTLPPGLKFTPFPVGSNTCTGSVGAVSLSGGTLTASPGAGSSCHFTVSVIGVTEGDQINTTSPITSTEGGTGATSNTAVLKVVAPPVLVKAFNPTTISLNGTTTLTFTITNPATNTADLTGVAFTDVLPTGLTVANGSSSTCGGTSTASGGNTITLTGATIAVNSQCVFSATVTGQAAGNYTNVTTNVSSTNGGSGHHALAGLTVASPPSITKSFNPTSIATASGGTAATSSVLSFTINNPNTNVALSGVAFTDNLPPGLAVATPNGLTGSCGAGPITAVSGSGVVSLSGGTLAASASCTFSVNVSGVAAGVNNNSVTVTSTEGGTGNTSNATITVVGPPVIIEAFGAASIPLTGTTSLQFTIQNQNATTTLTGVGFTDTLPAGLAVATPNGLTGNTCSTTPTAVAGGNSVSLSGASVNQGTQCTFIINVTGTTGGTKNNTTSQVTSNEGGTGGTASSSIDVVAPPTIQKAFFQTGIPLNGAILMFFTLTNPAANTAPENGVAFTDTMPTGLVVASPNQASSGCGGTVTAVAGTTAISLTGGTISVNTACTVVVNVKGTASGNYTNTTGPVSSINGGTGNTASANLSVAQPPSIVKVFGAATIPLNGSTSLTFTITNPAINTIPLTVAFTDTLPAGLVVATPNGLTNTCGGTVTATAGSGSVSLTGGTVAINSQCTLTVNITGTTAGLMNNSVPVASTQGGPGNTSNASITVVAPPSIAKAFGAATLPVGSTTSLTLTINNPDPFALTGVAVTDTLPFGLVIATPNGLTNTCGGTATAPAGGSTISLSGGTVAGSTNCTVVVNVTAIAGGTQVNVTGNVSSTNGGTGNTATASVNVPGPPLTINLTVSGGGNVTINPGDTATFVFTVNSGTPALGPINFSCNAPLPAGATCSFTNQGENQNTAQVTLNFATTGPSAPTTTSSQPQQGRGTAPLAALLLPVFGVVGLTQLRRGKKGKNLRLRIALWLGGMLLLLVMAGCGGHSTSLLGGNGNGGTPPGLYPITVTATSSANPSITATANVTVTVR